MAKQDHPDWFLDISAKNGKREPHDRRPGADNSRADIIGPRQGEEGKVIHARSREFWGKQCKGACGKILPETYRGTTGYCKPCANTVAKFGTKLQKDL